MLVFVRVVSGGFVAGTRAGFAFNDFPFMGGKLIPEGLLAYEPWYRNFFENIITVQFTHRILALSVLVSTIALAWNLRASRPRIRNAADLCVWAVCCQVILGIATLWLHVTPWVACLHQATGLLLFTSVLWLNHTLRAL
jgi:cytochrome c oxidase assembly protein subunit 15